MYYLTIVEDQYTWTFVGDALPAQPIGRAGHQCALQGNQMIVVGGVVATDILCNSPGIFVYNISSSAWQSNYKADSMVRRVSLSFRARLFRSWVADRQPSRFCFALSLDSTRLLHSLPISREV